jgi:hypothetical protein
MSKSFNQHTDAELLGLDNETINDAIRIEAIGRGLQPPIPLSDAIRKSEWRGYTRPAESITVFEIYTSGKYSTPSASGIAYLDEAKAMAALDGILSIDENTYGKGGPKLLTGTASVMKKLIGENPGESKGVKFEEFCQDNTEFDKVKDECLERLSKVRQDDYNKRVNAEKKTEYLRLAGGNEEIAKGFWSKVERTEWPT